MVINLIVVEFSWRFYVVFTVEIFHKPHFHKSHSAFFFFFFLLLLID
jgi:hypothetical protein